MSENIVSENSQLRERSLKDVDRELLIAHYSVRASRSLNWTSMMNQTPATALTGLAFLLAIALDSDSTAAARIIGAGLALVVSITAISALGRFRLSEIVDDEMLEKMFEAMVGEQTVSAMRAHGTSWRDYRKEITDREQKSQSCFHSSG